MIKIWEKSQVRKDRKLQERFQEKTETISKNFGDQEPHFPEF